MSAVDSPVDSAAGFEIKGSVTPEEIAALVVVLQAAASASAPPAPKPRSQWASPQRSHRTPLAHGLGGWRASALPR